MKAHVIFGIDGEIWKGYNAASRVICTSKDYLFFLLHKNKGKEFEHNGRKIKCLNFLKIANWERYQKLIDKKEIFYTSEARKEYQKKYKQSEHYKAYCKVYDKKYRESHRELKASIQRAYYRRKKRQEKQEQTFSKS